MTVPFRPFVLLAYLAALIALSVPIKIAIGQPSYLDGGDVLFLLGVVGGWFNHWIWSQD